MIPVLVPRQQLLAANGIFTLTLNAAFALGFALLGPLVVKVAGAEAVIVVVAGLYFLAAVFCVTLPASPPPPSTPTRPHHGGLGVGDAERAVADHVRPAARGLLVHPRPPLDRAGRSSTSAITASLDRRPRRARAGLRPADARAQGGGLRGRRPAARVRHRDRHPAAQLVRPLLPRRRVIEGEPDRARASCSRRCRQPGRSAASSSGRTSRAASTCPA